MIVYKILSGDDLDLHEGMHFSLNASDKLSEINEYRIPVMSFVEYEDYMTNTPKELLQFRLIYLFRRLQFQEFYP